MSLRRKLSYRIAFSFGIIMGLTLIVTYLLFRQYTREIYYKKLMERAIIAAHFYLEKDELTNQKYREIERRYRQMVNESIRIYYADDYQLFVDDTLHFQLTKHTLSQIVQNEKYSFKQGNRQFTGIIYHDNQGDFIIIASGINLSGNSALFVLARLLLIVFVIGLLFSYFLTIGIAKQTFKPFSNVIKKVNSISTENLHLRLEEPKGKLDELGSLIQTFNYFLERLENGVATQRNFLKNASHELRTPLSAIIGEIEIVQKKGDLQSSYNRVLESIKEDALRLKSIIHGLLLLSGLEMREKFEMTDVRVDEIVWTVMEKLNFEYPKANIQVDLSQLSFDQELLNVYANRELLTIAISNLIENAIKFSLLENTVVIQFDHKNQQLELRICDQGMGIEDVEKDKIFDLFYRSTDANSIYGNGIGLYLTRQILDLHRITLTVLDNKPKGTIMKLNFPIRLS
ncbi:MAG: HAMP domain-containing histidine kinase [Bacteroidetes bacterium]|nr:HAMP domain-containing histidine kinase [Bacteroidota bacterium]MBS1739492.1 HAMP domain-containing histidine kinase [Bacteroidota bacterium]